MINPYQSKDKYSFWSSGVATAGDVVPEKIYTKKWDIGEHEKIATAGSCFAQHIGKKLKEKKYHVLDVELPPEGIPLKELTSYGYSMYSARYGNIYTVRQLLQLAKEAFGLNKYENYIWKNEKGRFFDAFRPNIEPDGFDSYEEVVFHRQHHIGNVRKLFCEMDIFIFTMGLTEAWISSGDLVTYPTAPGTIAGEYDSSCFHFHNFNYTEIKDDFIEFLQILKEFSPQKNKKFLLTVSPVPLTATATNMHVLPATVYSKSVLRAVAGDLSNENSNIDYFPSYEIVSSPWLSFNFYEKNMRSVKNSGVELVMNSFFTEHPNFSTKESIPNADENVLVETQVVCEDEILDAFSRKDNV